MKKLTFILCFLTPFVVKSQCDSSVEDYNENSYYKISVFNNSFLNKNIKSTHYYDGTKVTYYSNPTVYNGSQVFINSGFLYTWRDATRKANGSNKTIQGVCPEGWRLPTVEDMYRVLANYHFLSINYTRNVFPGVGSKFLVGGETGFNQYLGGYGQLIGSDRVPHFYGVGVVGEFWLADTSYNYNHIGAKYVQINNPNNGYYQLPGDTNYMLITYKDTSRLSYVRCICDNEVTNIKDLDLQNKIIVLDNYIICTEKGQLYDLMGRYTLQLSAGNNYIGYLKSGVYICNIGGNRYKFHKM